MTTDPLQTRIQKLEASLRELQDHLHYPSGAPRHRVPKTLLGVATLAAITCVPLVAASFDHEVPNTFEPNTVLLAGAMNANFDWALAALEELDTRVESAEVLSGQLDGLTQRVETLEANAGGLSTDSVRLVRTDYMVPAEGASAGSVYAWCPSGAVVVGGGCTTDTEGMNPRNRAPVVWDGSGPRPARSGEVATGWWCYGYNYYNQARNLSSFAICIDTP